MIPRNEQKPNNEVAIINKPVNNGQATEKAAQTAPAEPQESGFKILNVATTKDSRTALLPGNYDHDPSVCQAEYNKDAPNTTFTYSSQTRGIAFEVPYNTKWGNQKFYLPPFVEAIEDGPKLFFGNISVGFEGGCGVGREMITYFLPPKTAAEELQVAEKWEGVKTSTKKIINDLEVVAYEVDLEAYCDTTSKHAIVIGKKFNYFFWIPCGGSLGKLESIINTAKLIE